MPGALTRFPEVDVLVKEYITALRQVCEIVDVPGTPRSLRLEDVQTVDDRVRLSWSFVDPEVLPGDHRSHERRPHGWLDLGPASGVPIERAREWWAEAQLAAARRYALQIDADWSLMSRTSAACGRATRHGPRCSAT